MVGSPVRPGLLLLMALLLCGLLAPLSRAAGQSEIVLDGRVVEAGTVRGISNAFLEWVEVVRVPGVIFRIYTRDFMREMMAGGVHLGRPILNGPVCR